MQDSTAESASYLSALRQIDSIPVPDLASTLNNPAEDEANEANISFLRTQIDPQDEWRAQNAEQQNSGSSRMADLRNSIVDDRARRERLQRVLARLNRIHEPAYGDRIPNHNSLYDWSPAAETGDEDAELREYIQDLRRQQPNTHPEVLRVFAQTQLDSERERRTRAQQSRFLQNSSDGSSQTESSLRSTAILQAVRRHPRFNARSRENVPRYQVDRQYHLRDYDPREPHPTRQFLPPIRASESSSTNHSDPRHRVRRAVLQDPTANDIPPTSMSQETLGYLANLRDSTSFDDSLNYAVQAGFDRKEFHSQDDFLVDVNDLPQISETSLLAAGATFEGYQQADSEADTRYDPWRDDILVPSASRLNSLPPPEYIYPAQQWGSPRRSISPQPYESAQYNRYRAFNGPKEWPVKVILHAVDYQRMTLSATMVAYDVPPPNHTSVPLHPPSTSSIHSELSHALRSSQQSTACPRSQSQKSIKTYLEGEIIDFRRNTLLTERFTSTAQNDLTYWRKLAPFRGLASDEELCRRLVSRAFLADVLRNYVLMRWKERCFVEPRPTATTNPSSSSSPSLGDTAADGPPPPLRSRPPPPSDPAYASYGLTISGFYYICMRRADGALEGLYCDPGSSPYQFLKLERRRDGWVWPAWEFK